MQHIVKEIFIGTYIDKGSCSVYKGELDVQQKNVSFTLSIKAGKNPSFLIQHSTKEYLYTVNEMSMDEHETYSAIVCLKKEKEQYVTHSVFSTEGDNACHISLSNNERYLFVSHYGSAVSPRNNGNISVFSLNEKGKVQSLVQTVSYTGSSVHPERQEKPHIHASISSKDGKYLFVSDLGCDCIYQYRIRTSLSNEPPLTFVHTIAVPKGNGPRHMAWDTTGTYLYVSCELSSSVSVYAYEASHSDATLRFTQDVKTFSHEEFPYPRTSASEIAYHDGYVYMANRGDDSLSIYRVEKDTTLNFVRTVSVEGKTPRHFKIYQDENNTYTVLVVAHQDDDTVALFSIQGDTIILEQKYTGIRKPVCFC